MTPRVSIVMPTRNRAPLLARAIASVQAQTMTEWELLVIDDRSADDTHDVLMAAADADPRIRPLRTDGIGAAAARNRAIAVAAAPFIAFLDDDDEWLGEKLQRQLAVAENDVVVYTGYVEVRDGFDVPIRSRRLGADAHRVLLRGNMLGHSTVLAPREMIVRAGGYDERLPRLQDWDLWIRLAPTTRFLLIPDKLARIHHTTESISASVPALLAACDILSRKISSLPRSLRADGYFGLALKLLTSGEKKLGHAYLRRALRTTPWSLRRWLGAAFAIALGRLSRKVLDPNDPMLQMMKARQAR